MMHLPLTDVIIDVCGDLGDEAMTTAGWAGVDMNSHLILRLNPKGLAIIIYGGSKYPML